jgi:hypothetical protein
MKLLAETLSFVFFNTLLVLSRATGGEVQSFSPYQSAGNFKLLYSYQSYN